MWSDEHGDDQPYHGKHFQLKRALNAPQLPRRPTRPHPPILIAGGGEQKTLRLVARYANACNIPPGPEIPKKLEVLCRHCEAEGRDYATIDHGTEPTSEGLKYTSLPGRKYARKYSPL